MTILVRSLVVVVLVEKRGFQATPESVPHYFENFWPPQP